MKNKLHRRTFALAAYAAVGVGALLLSAQGASAFYCLNQGTDGWIVGTTSVNSIACNCGGSIGTVQDIVAPSGAHLLSVNHLAGTKFSATEGFGWPGPGNNLTLLTDRGINDGTASTFQPQDYLIIGCRGDDGGQF